MKEVLRTVIIGFVVGLAFTMSACGQSEAEQSLKAATSESRQTLKARNSSHPVSLNIGDLQYLDKMLMQRDRATEAHKQEGVMLFGSKFGNGG